MESKPFITIQITRGTLLLLLAIASNLLTFVITKKVYYNKGMNDAVEYILEAVKGKEKPSLEGSTMAF